ncbi:MAG TPA: ABC transporter ATP-binding protein [Nitrospiria bacterium]|nr:ABC transporter ATP-binding protein [Nitrospiria bacterium]
MTIIELIQATMTYPGGKMPAVYDISFKVDKGKVLAILGPSGSGKTTLLRLIAGFEIPDRGRVLLGGREVSRPDHYISPEKRGVGMVFQDYALFPHLSVAQNVAFGLHHTSAVERRRKVVEVLTLVGLTGFEHCYPHELSGGQQQRVALARALAPNPIVVMLDEPFSNLDPDMRSRMRYEVQQILKRIGTTAVLVTHDHEEAFAMADQIAVLNGGRLEQLDTPEAIYHTPSTPFVADFVGHADFLPGSVESDGLIHSEIGQFSNEIGYPEGASLVVMIRPDDIHLVPESKGMGTVVSRQFRGSENLYRVSLPSGQILHSSEHSVAVYAPGTRVEIRLTATHTVLFKSLSVSEMMIG